MTTRSKHARRMRAVSALLLMFALLAPAGAHARAGDLDPSFGTFGGAALTDFEGRSDFVSRVAVQKDGKVVAAGTSSGAAGGADFAVARYTTNGMTDRSFDRDGQIRSSFGADDYASSVVIAPDGKIVIAGSRVTSSQQSYTSDFAVMRLTSGGALDKTFNKTGKVTTDFLGNVGEGDYASAAVVQPDGKIVVAGSTAIAVSVPNDPTGMLGSFTGHMLFARYNTDGSLDPTFGVGGKLILNFDGEYDYVSSLAIGSGGTVLAGGRSTQPNSNGAFTVLRLTANGAVDPTFGTAGRVTVDPGGLTGGGIDAMTTQRDGKIVAAGSAWIVPKGKKTSVPHFVLARFTSTGVLDQSFGGHGFAAVNIGGLSSYVSAVATQTDGKIVTGGLVISCSGSSRARFCTFGPAITRLSKTGALDLGYGSRGIVKPSVQIFGSSVAVQGNKAVVAGSVFGGRSLDFGIARLLA